MPADLSQIACSNHCQMLKPAEALTLLKQVSEWQLDDVTAPTLITRTLRLKNYLAVVRLVNQLAEIAQSINHHPNILFSFNEISIELQTHRVAGLSINDFIFAAKADKLLA